MKESRQIRNPFPGLRPFETDEYRLFFGREGQSDELIARLQRARFLAVVGASGSGKSSLIRAGLLPALRGGLMAEAGSCWRIAVMRPGGDPIGNLAGELARKDALSAAGAGLLPAEAEAVIEATLRGGSLGLVDVARQGRLTTNEKLLVVVDQFEELFRFRAAARERSSTDDEASAFVKLLLEASQQRDLSIYVVLTMRSDFLGDCAQFQGLPEAINDGQYLIPRQTRDERRVAITGPVGVTRGKITEPLVNRLLNDVGDNPDQLPILQHALMRTWDHWSAHRRNGEPIGIEHYQAIGTMADALSLHADEAFNELPDDRSRLIAEIVFKALSERGADNREIRRPTRLREICNIANARMEEVIAVIDVFRGGGRSFVMPPVGVALEPETVIDISHESLIRNWQRLKDWVNDEAQSARIYRRLAEAAVLNREGSERLLQDPALQIALDWREKSQANAAWAKRYHPDFATALSFLDASRADRDAQAVAERAREQRELEQARAFADHQARANTRLRWLLTGMVVMFLVSLATAAFAIAASRRASASEKVARDAQSTAEKSAVDVAEGAARLRDEKDKADLLVATLGEAMKKTEEALIAEKKALDSQKQATARANMQKLAAERSQRDAQTSFRVAMISGDRSSRHLNGIAQFQRGDYDQALQTLNGAMQGVEFEEEASKLVNYSSQDPGKKDVVMRELKGTRSSLLRDIAATQGKLGMYEDAVRTYTDALKLQVEYDAGNQLKSWNMFDSTYGLARAYQDRRERSQRTNSGADQTDDEDYLKAEDYYKQALKLQENLLKHQPNVTYLVDTSGEPILEGKQALRLAGGLENLARFYRDLGKHEKAEPIYKRILEMREKLPDDHAYIATLREVARFYGNLKKYKDAESLLTKAVRVLENADPEVEAAEVTGLYSDLGEIYAAQEGQESKAKYSFQLVRAFQEAIAGQKRGLHRRFGAEIFESMADAFAGLGNYERAASLYEDALETQKLMRDLQAIARLVHKRAELYREHLQDYPKAEGQYKIVLEAAEENPNNPVFPLPQALRNLGSLYANEMNKPADAEPLLKRSFELLSNAQNGTYPPLEMSRVLAELAKLYRRQNRTAELENTQKSRVEYAGKILLEALGRLSVVNLAALSTYTETAREYVAANDELAAQYRAQQREDDLLALYNSMLGDTDANLNPAACCIRLDALVDVSVFAFYSKTLEDYRQLLLKRGMTKEAAKIADYVYEVARMQKQAKKYQHLFQ